MRVFGVTLKEYIGFFLLMMCIILILLKSSMTGVHLKLVKEIPRNFQNSNFICWSLFGILIRVRLLKILGNQQDGWGLHTPLEMKCANTLRHKRKTQNTSLGQSSRLDIVTLVLTSCTPTKNRIQNHKSMTWR